MNREQIKKSTYFISKPLSLPFIRRLTKQNFIFPFYHLVAEETPIYIKHFYTAVNRKRFVSDLEFLLKYYQPADFNDLMDFVNSGKRSSKPRFLLSFDDGLKECYEVIYPILKEKGIPAIFFVNPDFVDNRSMFYKFKIGLIIDKLLEENKSFDLSLISGILTSKTSNKAELVQRIKKLSVADLAKIDKIAGLMRIDFTGFLQVEKPYMSLTQLREMSTEGFLIGSHSMNHPLFSELINKQQVQQFEKSMEFIQKNIAPAISTFAFPFTDFNVSRYFFDYLNNSQNVDITFGTAGIKNDNSLKHLQRIPMEVEGVTSGQQIIRSEYSYFMLKSLLGKNRIVR